MTDKIIKMECIKHDAVLLLTEEGRVIEGIHKQANKGTWWFWEDITPDIEDLLPEEEDDDEPLFHFEPPEPPEPPPERIIKEGVGVINPASKDGE